MKNANMARWGNQNARKHFERQQRALAIQQSIMRREQIREEIRSSPSQAEQDLNEIIRQQERRRHEQNFLRSLNWRQRTLLRLNRLCRTLADD